MASASGSRVVASGRAGAAVAPLKPSGRVVPEIEARIQGVPGAGGGLRFDNGAGALGAARRATYRVIPISERPLRILQNRLTSFAELA
jgi:hypothetical protein